MQKPNILIFMTDQQRGDSIPPYSRAKTPNLEKFSKQGIAFSNAFTIAPHCCPARATFFSGLYPSQHGVWNNVDVGNTLSRGLYEGVRLFSEDLKEAGYSMYYGGKWHVSNVESPLDRGFETMNIPKAKAKTEIRHISPDKFEWEIYKNYMQDKDRREGEIIRKGYKTYTHYGEMDNPFGDRDVVSDAINIIRARKKSDNPWCQFIGTLGPHDPYFVPQKYLDMYDINEIELPETYYDKMTDKPALYRKTRDGFEQLSEQEHKEAIRHYLAFCTYEDALFGEVLEALEESGESKHTLVLYISDHGDYMAEHGLWCKGLPCFRSAYHIPAVVRWPEGIAYTDRIISNYITLADFAPTFLELADVDVKREFTGRSLVPFFKNKIVDNWNDVFYTQSNGNELYGIQRSVMTNEWKFVYNGFDYDELYDIKNDPYETTNLINDESYDNVVKELSQKLWRFAYKTGDVCINPYIMVGLASYGPGIAFEENIR